MRGPELVAVGLACIDYLVRVDRGDGGRILDFLIQGGGLMGTAAVAAARLGARTAIWTRIGDDRPHSTMVVEGFEEEGVDTRGINVVAGGKTPFSVVMVDGRTGEREIYFSPGFFPEDPEIEMSLLEMIDGSKCVLVDGTWPKAAMAAARKAKDLGIPIVGDINHIGGNEDLLRLIDFPIIPRGCAEEIAGPGRYRDALKVLHSLGARVSAVTLGEDGSLWYDGKEFYHQPSFKVEVVDTTGCGDVFHGAFAFCLARGWELEKARRFASAVAAMKARKLGGRTGIPKYDEVMDFLSQAQGP
jgi:sulfofructose kinase